MTLFDLTNRSSDPFFTTPIFAAAHSTQNTYFNIRTTLLTALLIGLASEHLYIGLRWTVRHALEAALWHNSPEAVALHRTNFVLKRSYLSEVDIKSQPDRNAPKVGVVSTAFFAQGDHGLAEIRRLIKNE